MYDPRALGGEATPHARYMARALDLARRAEGMTRPNPPVGAVLVKASKIIGEGYHRKAGGSHAEVEVLRQAGGKAKGASLYVTMEPCSTFGRTPPCAKAVIAAGIKEVFVSVRDPNPAHNGAGFHMLEQHGVRVTEGLLEKEGRDLIEPFKTWMLLKRPMVTLKLGLSLDGKIADFHSASHWITGAASRAKVQELRRTADAILVGAHTVRLDDPSLIPRPARGRKPLRVIVDSRLRIPMKARLLNDTHRTRTLVATTSQAPSRRLKAVERKGASCLLLPSRGNQVSLPSLMKALAGKEVLHVLCEGGGELAASLIRSGLVDRYVLFVAPLLLGGGLDAIGGPGWKLAGAPRLAIDSAEQCGNDLVIIVRPA